MIRRSVLVAAAAASAAVTVVGMAGAARAAASTTVALRPAAHAARPGRLPVRELTVKPGRYDQRALAAQSAAGATIPLWRASIVSGGKTYSFQMVGRNPTVKESSPAVSIGAPIIPVSFTFATGNNGGIFNPSTAVCGEKVSDVRLVTGSPIFTKLSYTDGGTPLGTGQYVDIFQRANFYSYTKPGGLNPGYAVNLVQKVLPTVGVSVNASAGQVFGSGCGATGLVSLSAWDSFVRTSLIPGLAARGVRPTTIPVILVRNVAFYQGTPSNCCALGYHSSYAHGGLQTYTVTDIDDSGNFSGVQDVSDLAHEVGEWMDDPTGNNPTPAWGHIGQVTGCQGNLEVGDPLTGHNLAIASSGRTYHPQELAFFSWFYRQVPSIGVNGFYSLAGTFRSPAAACH